MRDYLNIGATPASEACFPVGHPLARMESAIYCKQLRREFPHGDFKVKAFSHDFGDYYEVVAWFDDSDSNEATLIRDTAYDAEACSSPTWDTVAKLEIAELYKDADKARWA